MKNVKEDTNTGSSSKWTKGLAVFLAVETLFMGNGAMMDALRGEFPGELRGLVFASEVSGEEDGLLIEDEGLEIAVNEGADLEELKAEEKQKAEEQRQSEEARRQLEEAQRQAALENTELVLEVASKDKLQEHMERLTEMESPTGSDGELIIGQYIEEVMENYGYLISEQSFHEGFLNADGVDVPGVNILAERGADAENRHSDILIISTHYDSKTVSQEGDFLANDKTGAAVLLEMARVLSDVETDTDICFLFLSGEEDGLYGSSSFIKTLGEEHRDRIVGQIHVEQVGYSPKEGAEYSYVLKTLDGMENYLGNLVREEALAIENVISVLEGGNIQATREDAETNLDENTEEYAGESADGSADTGENWVYISDEKTSQKSFADVGITAVTVSQNVAGDGKNPEEAEAMTQSDTSEEMGADSAISTSVTPTVSTEKLQEITDILAAVVGDIMSERTGSLL